MFIKDQFKLMKNTLRFTWMLLLAMATLVFTSCNEEDEVIRIFEANFEGSSAGLESLNSSAEVTVSFSTPTIQETTVVIEIEENGVVYGSDYETSPAATDGTIEVTVPSGSENASFSVTRKVEFIESGNNVSFTLVSVDGEEDPQIVGSSFTVSFEKVVSESGQIDIATGGSTQPNQVYIDFSSGTQTAVRRDAWELGFYNGSENRVFLNSSIKASAAVLTGVTDLNSVTSAYEFSEPVTLYYYPDFATKTEIQVSNVEELTAGLPVGYTQYGDEDNGVVFTDLAAGNLDETAIAEISTNADENFVYIVSLGNEIPDEEAEAGSINISGDHRGFMKVRILTDGNSYTLQYAELDATTFTEVNIAKSTYNTMSAFSLVNGGEVAVEPESYDINFTGVFSYYSGGFGLTYSDYAIHNTLGGVGVYKLHTEDLPGGFGAPGETANTDISYENFTLADVDENEFVFDDRTVINSGWRSTSQGVAYDYMYFIVKDVDGDYYKVQFTALLSADGERGYPQLRYALLQ